MHSHLHLPVNPNYRCESGIVHNSLRKNNQNGDRSSELGSTAKTTKIQDQPWYEAVLAGHVLVNYCIFHDVSRFLQSVLVPVLAKSPQSVGERGTVAHLSFRVYKAQGSVVTKLCWMLVDPLYILQRCPGVHHATYVLNN